MNHRVFVTGAGGYLGGAIAARLKRAGHTIFGLTRDPNRGEALAALGIQPVVGSLETPEAFVATLKNCDVAVHAAFDDDGPAALDQKALEAIREAAQDGRIRRLLYTSGLWVHGDTGNETVDETTPLAPLELVRWRAAHEEVALDLAEHEVKTVVFRPGIVYGGSRGILGSMFAAARDQRVVRYPGAGSQRWSLVHRDDVAEAYALGLEHAKGGERYLLADGATATAREIAEAVARATGAVAEPWPAEEVVKRLGEYGRALMTTTMISAARARRELGWVPRHTSFVAEAADLYRDWETSASPVK